MLTSIIMIIMILLIIMNDHSGLGDPILLTERPFFCDSGNVPGDIGTPGDVLVTLGMLVVLDCQIMLGKFGGDMF